MLCLLIAICVVIVDILINRLWLEKTDFKSKTLTANLIRLLVSLTLAFLFKLPLGLFGIEGGLIPFLVGIILFIVSFFSLRTAFSQNVVEQYLPLKQLIRRPFWQTVVLLGIIVPIGEEFLFRGVIQNLMAKALGPWLGGVFSMVIFVGVHFGNVLSGFETKEQFKRMFLGRLLITGVLTWLYIESRSIWLVVTIHALQDLGTYLLVYHYTKKLGSQRLPSTMTSQESRTDIESSS